MGTDYGNYLILFVHDLPVEIRISQCQVKRSFSLHFAPDSSVHQGFCPGVPMFVLSQPLVKRLWTLLATTSQNSVARRPEGSMKMVVVCSCEML